MKSLNIKILICIFFVFALNCIAKETQIIPRKIVGLYKTSKNIPTINRTNIHRFAEMPLNYLGLDIEYYDINKGLPENIINRKDVRGVLTWFDSGTIIDKPYEYLKWGIDVIRSGKKFVIMGSPGFLVDSNLNSVSIPRMNRFWRKFGLKFNGDWVESTHDSDLIDKDHEMVNFERKYPLQKHSYENLITISQTVTTHLAAKRRSSDKPPAQLISTSKNGGYVAEGYACNVEYNDKKPESLQWYINPFLFFQIAFDTSRLPKPDVTTIAGRRIYFSHIDGDGWLSQTKLEEYTGKSMLCSEVIMEKAIKPYSELPVTIGPIVAEMDPDWEGTASARKIAESLFILPNVEIGAHTYTHPYSWKFFENYDRKKELKSNNWFSKLKNDLFGDKADNIETGIEQTNEDYRDEAARAYEKYPFDLKLEIGGAIKYLDNLAPKNKKGKIILWSGSCVPFEKAVKETRENKLGNINGGDTRFDRIFPSYAWVASIGRHVGEERHIYAASSNENTYTNLWTSDFFGFKYLVDTFKNTESPKRVKPMNIYYHMYSGERDASINALISNLEYAVKSEIAPITASHYSSIADGFYTTEIFKNGVNSWIIKNRGELQTIRFAKSVFKAVDFKNSTGVVGQRHFQDSLYVYLDASVLQPVITLKNTNVYWTEPPSSQPYLIESRLLVWNLKRTDSGFDFVCQGFGNGRMSWRVPVNGVFKVIVDGKSVDNITEKNILNLNLKFDAIDKIKVQVKYPVL